VERAAELVLTLLHTGQLSLSTTVSLPVSTCGSKQHNIQQQQVLGASHVNNIKQGTKYLSTGSKSNSHLYSDSE